LTHRTRTWLVAPPTTLYSLLAARCSLLAARCPPASTAHCPLPTTQLPAAHYPLPTTTHCYPLLPTATSYTHLTALCPLHTKHYTLHSLAAAFPFHTTHTPPPLGSLRQPVPTYLLAHSLTLLIIPCACSHSHSYCPLVRTLLLPYPNHIQSLRLLHLHLYLNLYITDHFNTLLHNCCRCPRPVPSCPVLYMPSTCISLCIRAC